MNSDLPKRAASHHCMRLTKGNAQGQAKWAAPLPLGPWAQEAAHHQARMLSSYCSLEKSSRGHWRSSFTQVLRSEICLIPIYLLWLRAHTDKAPVNPLPLNVSDIAADSPPVDTQLSVKGSETPPYSFLRLASCKCIQRLLLTGEIWSLHSKLRPICFQRMQHCPGFKCTPVFRVYALIRKQKREWGLTPHHGACKGKDLGSDASRVRLVFHVGHSHCSSSLLFKESASSDALCQVSRSSRYPWQLIAPWHLLCYITNGAWLNITVQGCDFSGWNVISRNSGAHKSNSHISENKVPFINF